MDSANILDETYDKIKQQVWLDNEHKYTVFSVWPVATRFLWKDIKSFKSFPYLAFMSPEPDSGKTRALDVVTLSSYNPIKRGKYTPAVMLRYIDREWKKHNRYVTTSQDEIDNVFAHGKDNADLIQLYNLGNEERGTVSRCDLNSDEILETKAFCPKVFAGLKAAKLPDTTKTRTIIISMKPATFENKRPEELDETPLLLLSSEIDKWASAQELNMIDIPDEDISFLINRDRQVWKPLLTVSKAVSEDWYQKMLLAVKYFVHGKMQEDKGLTHKILLGAYKIRRGGDYTDRIHSESLLTELHELGIPKWMDKNGLAEHLSGYEIRPTQVKINQINRNGYYWHMFDQAFKEYITEKEIMGVEADVSPVDPVDP